MNNPLLNRSNKDLKFVYSDNDTLSIIFNNNEILMGVVGEFNNNLKAPILEGDEIGNIEFMSNDRIVFSAPLLAIESVDEKGFFGRIWARIMFWIYSLFSFD